MLIEFERERSLQGGWKQVYPASAGTLRDLAGHLRLFDAVDAGESPGSKAIGGSGAAALREAARLSKVLLFKYLAWVESGGAAGRVARAGDGVLTSTTTSNSTHTVCDPQKSDQRSAHCQL